MKLESIGILIDLRPFGERDCVAHIFTRDFGVMTGMLKGAAVAKKNRPLVGQIGAVSWNARLDSQLGAFHWESSRNLAAPIMSDAVALSAMNAAFALIQTLLPEREKYEGLYDETIGLMEKLSSGLTRHQGGGWSKVETYLSWEISLLRELGYALDLSRCSGCGALMNLNHLSPKTGRAVCDTCAAPYIGRLFELPLTLATTEKFIARICEEQGAKFPMARKFIK